MGHNSVSCIYHDEAEPNEMSWYRVFECVCVDESQRKNTIMPGHSDTQQVNGLNSHSSLNSEIKKEKKRKERLIVNSS